MGKILSGPKAPPIQQVVQAPTPSTAIDTSASTTQTDTGTDVETDTQISTALRQESLLRRSRGRLGTINTSFRGFFDDVGNSLNNARKTLLGE